MIKKSHVFILLILSLLSYVALEYKNELPYLLMVNIVPSEIKYRSTLMNQSVAAFYTCYTQIASTNRVRSDNV